MGERIVVGMSGGVDSSVAALLLADAQARALRRLGRAPDAGRAAHVPHHLGVAVERDEIGLVGGGQGS